MQLFHLPEQYYEQFRARFLFDLERSSHGAVIRQPAPSSGSGRTTLDAMKVIRESPAPSGTSIKPASSPVRNTIELNQKKIARLHEESAQLQERLTVEDEKEQEPQAIMSMPDPIPVATMVSETRKPAPEVDEDWQIILQQWQPEHWEVISLLYQGQSTQLTTVERKVHRPVSSLIDEINAPVDEQLGDLLIDPDTQTIARHLQTIVESLVHWYLSSIQR